MCVASIETNYEHIELNDEGIPMISDANMKVVELVLSKISYGWSPEELHFQYPHLTMGQIHSALAYYWDHQEEMEMDIERRRQRVQEIRKEVHPPSLLLNRLKSKGLL